MLREMKKRYWIAKMNWHLQMGDWNDRISQRLLKIRMGNALCDFMDRAKRMTIAKCIIAMINAARYIL